MNVYELLILSSALAMDAMIVSFSYGLVICSNKIKNSLLLAFAFGLFQFLMPVIGWRLTDFIYNYVKNYSKWIVFSVFIFLGLKFFKEAFSKTEKINITCISFLCLLSLAVATSIDALGAGISIRMISNNILLKSCIIGVVTFLLSILGFYFSLIFKSIKSQYLEIIGALIFIYLAFSSL